MNRRVLLIGVLSAGAAAAGAGLGLWRHRQGRAGTADLWNSSFATPDGATLVMDSLRGRPLLLNFWATWCPPCVTEMPLLDAFAVAHPDWNVLALAVDAADPVRRFMSERRLKLPVALAGDAGLELGHRLGNIAGGLPFSVAFTGAGAVAHRKLGAVDENLLQGWTSTVR
ncbi:MAG: TlpA disulfide reductase family protein [Caldimonas sp.]